MQFSEMKVKSPWVYCPICAILLLWLGTWLHAKYQLYWGMHYSSDLFLHLQISKSFYLGRGLFYDNIFAPNSYIHSYFLLLLLAPFSFSFGAFGLPIAYFLFFVWAVYFSLEKGESNIFGVAALLLGPISFWLFDDPSYGFHSELLFFPLGVLLAISLKNQSKLFYLFAALIVLNREDGAIVACTIHSVYLLSTLPFKQDSLLKLSKVVAVWVLVFFTGLLVLKVFGDGAAARQDNALAALNQIFSSLDVKNAFLEMLWGTLLLLLPALGLLVLRANSRTLIALLLCSLPVIAVSIIASFAYLPSIPTFHYHGTSWPYRFGMLWTLVASAYLFSPSTKIGRSIILSLVVMCLSLYGQNYFLETVRNYSMLERLTLEKHPSDKLTIKEKVVLNCLNAILPSDTSITVSGPFTVYFSHLDWSYGGNLKHMWKPAEVIVCDEGKFGHNNLCREEYAARPKGEWAKKKVQGLMIAFKRNSEPVSKYVRACL